jgi:hypothetical protein
VILATISASASYFPNNAEKDAAYQKQENEVHEIFDAHAAPQRNVQHPREQRLCSWLGKLSLHSNGIFTTRCHNDFDWRPSIAHGTSKFQPIHGAGHVNVSKYRSDVAATFEDFHRLVGVGGLNDLETFVFSNLDGAQAMSVSSSTTRITGRFFLLSDTRLTHAYSVEFQPSKPMSNVAGTLATGVIAGCQAQLG